MKKLTLVLLSIIFCVSAYAADSIGSIKKFSGKVTLFDGTSPRGTDISKSETAVFANNKVATKRDSSVLVLTTGGDKVALGANAVATFTSTNKINPSAGKVVFSIKKRGGESGITVGLTTAVIGVKGTEFLVDMSEDGKCKVYLKEGSIAVESLEGDFSKHKAVVMDEYEAYIKQVTGEYDKYLEDLQKQYTEYVKSFTMTAGQAISIDGKDVNDVTFDEEANKAFELLEY